MSEIQIRAAEPADIETIHRIISCPGVVAGTTDPLYQTVEQVRARYAPTSPLDYLLVAEVDGRVVGLATLNMGRNPRRRHAGSLGIAVHDDYQRQGIGATLMTATLDLADNWLNLKRIELQVFVDNTPAIHLYEKFGFEIEGTLRACALRNGDYIDVYVMARLR